MATKEDFYHELDSKAKHSFCSCQSFAIVLLILVVATVAAIAWAGKKITTAVLPNRQITADRQDVVNLQEKTAELAKAPGASTTLTLTERELTSLLVEAANKDANFPLKGLQAEINPNDIVVTGTAAKLLNTTLQIHLLPVVTDGKVKMQLTKIRAGTLAVPNSLTDVISKSFDDLLVKQLSNLQGVNIKSILLNEGKLTITGTILGTPSPS
jgi:uncharacterized protein YpmS